MLDSLRATVYRQTLFSEFEDFAHSKLEAGEPLTYEDYNNKYYELNKKYYGNQHKNKNLYKIHLFSPSLIKRPTQFTFIIDTSYTPS